MWMLLGAGAMVQMLCGAVIVSSVNTRQLSVGDRVHFSVSIMAPTGAGIVPPDPSSGMGSLTVKEWNSRKFEQEKADSVVFEYAITTYTPEPCTIPSLSYVIESGGKQDTLVTEPVPLSVIPMVTGDSADIMDLKPQQTAGKRPLVWLWLLGAAAIITAAMIALRYSRRRKRAPLALPPKPPYEEAMEALAALRAKQYLQKGLVREFVFELSDILKRYIERRFGVNAAEFTTEEMLAWLGISPLDKGQRNVLEWFFRTTDPVKFAKYLPDQDTVERFEYEVCGFIEATRPRPEEESGQESAAKAAEHSTAPPKEPGGAS
ncbi:MAG: DUF4381 family protein [Chitinispirillaceae bacterium]|nr:DUF4381 family protein [Chitinispirillaceae bacterium]